MIIHSDWQVRNSQRKYPIDEACSAAGDDGTLLPEDFLVDAAIWVPKYQYVPGVYLRYVCLSSVRVSPSLVSLTLLGCSDKLGAAAPVFVPLGSVTLAKPVDAYRNYPIEPLLDGVMGWVSFGNAIMREQPLSLLFSQPSQAMLVPKTSRFYDTLPISDVSVYGGAASLVGDVRIAVQPPFIAEIKDMRVQGETQDRKMLVISMEQTEEVLSAFAGNCGRRPETGNCVNTPITSIAGVAPDCTGNIHIQFDPEITVRNFTNPFYPSPDPIPLRGGICLDSAFSVNQMCDKVMTLPDDQGLLPGAYNYKRPCDLTVPFATSFSDTDSFKQVQITSGYAYMDDYSARITAGLGDSAEMSPCFDTLKLSPDYPTKRAHAVTFGSTPNGSSVGMFALDTINTRILAKVEMGPDEDTAGIWTVSKYNKGLQTDDEVIASGVWPANTPVSSIGITVDSERNVSVSMGIGSTDFQLASDDVYYDPSGKAGVYVGGVHGGYNYLARPAVGVSGYTVQDVQV